MLGYIGWVQFPGGPEVIVEKAFATKEEAIEATKKEFADEKFANENGWVGIDYAEVDDGFVSVIETFPPKYEIALGSEWEGFALIEIEG